MINYISCSMPLLVLHYQFKNNIIATHPRSLDWDGSGHVDAVFSGGHRALESNVMHGSAAKVVGLILKQESGDLYFGSANATTNYTLH